MRSGAMKTDAAFMPHAFITHLFASPVKLSKKAISLRCGSNIAKQIRAVETKTSREYSCAAAARHYGNVIEREIMSRWRMQLRQREDKAADRRQARSVVRDVIIITKPPSFYMECETGALFPPHTQKKTTSNHKIAPLQVAAGRPATEFGAVYCCTGVTLSRGGFYKSANLDGNKAKASPFLYTRAAG